MPLQGIGDPQFTCAAGPSRLFAHLAIIAKIAGALIIRKQRKVVTIDRLIRASYLLKLLDPPADRLKVQVRAVKGIDLLALPKLPKQLF